MVLNHWWSTFVLQVCRINTFPDILHLPYCQSVSFDSLCFLYTWKIFDKKAAYLIFQLSYLLSPQLVSVDYFRISAYTHCKKNFWSCETELFYKKILVFILKVSCLIQCVTCHFIAIVFEWKPYTHLFFLSPVGYRVFLHAVDSVAYRWENHTKEIYNIIYI